MPMMTTTGSSSPLRSSVVGEPGGVPFRQWQRGLQEPAAEGGPAAPVRSDSTQLAWLATSFNNVPPRQSLQTADAFIVEMLAGTTNTASRRVHFLFLESSGGKLHVHTTALTDSNTNQDPMCVRGRLWTAAWPSKR